MGRQARMPCGACRRRGAATDNRRMSSPPLDSVTTGSRYTPWPRQFLAWWRKLSPARQDRIATFGPLLSVMLFLAAIVAAFWYLRTEEIDREQQSIQRDTEVVQQQIRLRLIDNQEQLGRLAREVATRSMDADDFVGQGLIFLRERAEILSLTWLQADQSVRARYVSPALMNDTARFSSGPPAPDKAARLAPPTEAEAAFADVRVLRVPVYSRPFRHGNNGPYVFQSHVPIIERGTFMGAIVAEYAVDAMLRYFVPAEVAQRHVFTLLDLHEQILSSTVSGAPPSASQRRVLYYSLPVAPAGGGLTLRGSGQPTSFGLIGNTLFWMVVALSALTVWMLMGTWQHMRRRLQIQGALIQETNFRRAMENSMLTGMRAMDMEGRITYVNPAFCAMTGFSESELIGRLPPFPHWPRDRMEENTRLFQQELQGRSPAGGIEVRVMRKDGTQFDARMYVSPLIDARGQQTGWMTSMTNITEAKRIRDQLSASHERFTTVLEGLDAAVSVLSVQQGELLFANRSYRLWFGADAAGHASLAGHRDQLPSVPYGDHDDEVDGLGGLPAQELMEASSDSGEVYVETLQKWFDVRARYLQWTDGRLAQMLIATDITARKRAEEQAAHQAEKAQVTSRLVTMGEMASSVAHELNQPLTAIINYCNGMLSRVRAGSISEQHLVEALDKTARQAQRAGQIIHRIRAFVKRSEPQRQEARALDIVEDAVDLAGIELRRRNVSIQTYVAQRLPPLHVDPILIEQVLLNLLKNAAEAIDNAQLPAARRNIELRVVPRHDPERGGMIEFSVTDTGPGLKDAVIARLYESFFSTKVDGLGIGLSLCRSIIESHHGRIGGENIYNGETVVGCRFTFTLPVETTVDLSKHAEVS
jgi:PAS domain S-box-containing protein